ncbi:MAG: low molecular weight phosphotyrosine protein phosphatase [Xanthomonadales bacterium]|nr:low molecular weight phosphotyrosine protein phosphatase [Gammaproteobacteria bacterium]MBT8049986.1 low molecular weight phosphotyrosine protein phosphatase [Gammaproteobacteria bacterium]MBT8057619.1 low molecular weight phosphotyrosine protein phosphatase [Gammaproteobacteria bacterium]NNJ79702.1 low molecular weight phosphotyrosine protein phosphatase [Xanthomonadales bacterium]NNL05002.1 low molecular weight phosphotyrosine protein phosphatase [Xanthomonadales bacterium]
MKRVLFVCMGNICRSPAAEGVFRKLVENAGADDRFKIDSAGTIGYHAGEPADSRMRQAASRRGYSLDSRARRVVAGDFGDFDLIVTMDEANYRDVAERDTGQGARVVRMTDYCRRHRIDEVPDPYYGGSDGFENVLNILEDACSILLEELDGD